ncbi:MAG: protein kinase [Marinicella sp.]
MNEGIITHLPIGTKLEHYTITKLLGKGGFGVTYLAEDTRLKQKVAIKEYFPSEMGVRANDSITLKAQSERVEDYQFGLKRFLDEARTLAQFKHPNIVRVSNFLEMNGTAYMVMDYEQGEDLSDYLKRTGFKGGMPETELKGYLVPILQGLQAVHEKACFTVMLNRVTSTCAKVVNLCSSTSAQPVMHLENTVNP